MRPRHISNIIPISLPVSGAVQVRGREEEGGSIVLLGIIITLLPKLLQLGLHAASGLHVLFIKPYGYCNCDMISR